MSKRGGFGGGKGGNGNGNGPPRNKDNADGTDKEMEGDSASTGQKIRDKQKAEMAPPRLFPVFRYDSNDDNTLPGGGVPQPPVLTQADRELTERSRFLSETLRYSGYYVVPSPSSTVLLLQHHLVSSSFTPSNVADGAGRTVQQIYTPQLERYSDRYRKILGKHSFYHEIVSD